MDINEQLQKWVNFSDELSNLQTPHEIDFYMITHIIDFCGVSHMITHQPADRELIG